MTASVQEIDGGGGNFPSDDETALHLVLLTKWLEQEPTVFALDPARAVRVLRARGGNTYFSSDVDSLFCGACGIIVDECACEAIAEHEKDCPVRLAASCPVEIPCEPHDVHLCPICDMCTCGATTGL